jgi:hypothetical protein
MDNKQAIAIGTRYRGRSFLKVSAILKISMAPEKNRHQFWPMLRSQTDIWTSITWSHNRDSVDLLKESLQMRLKDTVTSLQTALH